MASITPGLHFSEAHKTSVPVDQARHYLSKAWQLTFNAPVTSDQLALVMAQSALETGQWQKMYDWNFGNLVASSAWTGMTSTHPESSLKFRAYAGPESGAMDYLDLLDRRADWRAGVQTGNPRAFMAALNNPPRYCTAKDGGPCVTYGHEMERLFKQFGGKLPPSSAWPVLLGVGLVGIGAWWYSR